MLLIYVCTYMISVSTSAQRKSHMHLWERQFNFKIYTINSGNWSQHFDQLSTLQAINQSENQENLEGFMNHRSYETFTFRKLWYYSCNLRGDTCGVCQAEPHQIPQPKSLTQINRSFPKHPNPNSTGQKKWWGVKSIKGAFGCLTLGSYI